MKKLILKFGIYSISILICLEILVRIFYLGKDTPHRFVDDFKVEKWKPNQHGFSVTGNRRQNFSEYYINSSGFNSYREFNPTYNKVEIALVGDSFIEGFHQNYYNSIGKKIEKEIPGIEVYEYGYAGYDFADQLHLINAYSNQFKKIDLVILGIKFSNDLTRGDYNVIQERLALETPLNNFLKRSKLLVYTKSIGMFDAPKRLIQSIFKLFQPKEKKTIHTFSKEAITLNKRKKELRYLSNFKSLVATYGFEKDKFVLLLDSKITPVLFLNYLNETNYTYLDISESFSKATKPTTLIYDKHWNNYGRERVAILIAEYLKKEL